MIVIDAPGRADEIVEALPSTGLEGTAFDADIVYITDTHGSDEEDVAFELEWYADRLGIADVRIVPASQACSKDDPSTNREEAP